jgi:hypothetical protein
VEHYTEFVPFREMFEKLAEMDIVLFLVDNEVGNARHYNRYKISGTSTLIKAFRKACACSTDFPVDDSLADKSFYYEGSDIGSLLKRIADGTIRSGDVRQKTARYGDQTLFSLPHQRAGLVALVNEVAGMR